MAETAADRLVETIQDWGVEVVFGMPGDGINGIMEALRTRQDRIRFIQVRHEEAAAFMACGYAKVTGKLGVCLATSGPGGIHLLNGLYDARADGQPVLAITGMPYHDLISTGTQQDVEMDKLCMDVAKYSARIMGAGHVENVMDLACRTALAYRGVAHVSIPVDVQEHGVSPRAHSSRNIPGHTSDVFAAGARLPAEEDLRLAAGILNSGSKVAILCGQGALGAGELLEETAERLGAPIVKALLGKAVVPDDSPYTTGGIGLLGTRASQEVMEACDTLLVVGSTFPYIEFYPRPGQARGVQIDLDPARIGLRYPVEVGLVGDSRRTLQALLPHLARKTDRGFLERAQSAMRDWSDVIRERGTRGEVPMKPQVVAHELGRRLRPDAIVAFDSGTVTAWVARHIPAQKGQQFIVSGGLASMACAVPYAIAAQLAYPARQVVAFVGDGGFAMLMAEFATAVKYRLPIKVVLVKNNTLGQIKWEQMIFLGNPEYGVELQPIDFAAVAQACGGTGLTVEDPREMGKTLERALAVPGPVLVEAVVDPYEPPMPGKATIEQAAMFGKALLRGEPNRVKIAWTVISDRVRELV
jgi:pyruvate dehydrogenase (quinone)/pyruvate oxidase